MDKNLLSENGIETIKIPCKGKTPKGNPCGRAVMPGTDHCNLKEHNPDNIKLKKRLWDWIDKHRLLSIISLFGICISVAGISIAIFNLNNYFEDKRKNRIAGELVTTKILLSTKSKIYPELEIGDSGTVFKMYGTEGKPIIQFFGDTDLTIAIDQKGNAKVSFIIRDKTGNVVAEIVENEWKLKNETKWDRNYSQDSLEVKDNSGDVVLQVKVIGNRVQLQAKLWHSSGKGVMLVKSDDPNKKGASFLPMGGGLPDVVRKIKPIFNYPSELHLGELVD